MRQNYSISDLQSVMDHYPALGNIKNAELFTSGFENSNFLVETDRAKVVLKVFEGMDIALENVLFEIEIMDRLFKAGTKSPEIHRTSDGALFAKFGEKVAVIMSYIEGENMAKKTISDALAAEIGAQVGKMDSALQIIRDGSKTRQGYEFDLKNFMNLKPWIQELGSEFDHEMISNIFRDFASIQVQFEKMPAGLIHNDIVLHNILAHGDELKGIIDFSDMVFSPYIQNVAVAFTQCFFTYNWQPNQAGIFLKNYMQHHPLSSEELSVLRTLVAGRFAMLIVAFNHWNVAFGVDEQRTEFIRDNVGFLNRFMEISEQEFSELVALV